MTPQELQIIAAAAKEGALLATKEWQNVREAAAVFGVSEWTIRDALKGKLPFSKALGRILIARADIEKLLGKKKVDLAAEKQMKDFINELTRKKARL